MSRRTRIACFAAVLLGALVAASPVLGEVRIEEDEVVFSLRAPQATDVYLVGDFNNWNPTYEKMEAADGRFEVRLFLLPGTYRYKFVVDGSWIADPDDASADASRGSVFVLVERAGGLALADEQAAGEEAREVLLTPSMRYSGAFFLDHGDTESRQALDVWARHSSERVDASANLKTIGDSWTLSPLGAEILFDRGYVDLKLGNGVIKAFENDTTWSSSDPFHLFGDVGVYGYNAGFERHGFSADLPFLPTTRLRGLYSDKIGERPGPPIVIESEAFGDFASSATPDTLVYRYAETFGDEDAWGVEFAGDMGSFDFGYVKRGNKGYQPGSVAGVSKFGSSFETVVYTTREFWNADVGWLRWRFLSRLSAIAGLGWSETEVRTEARWASVVEELGDVGVGQTPETFETSFTAQTDKRWRAGLEFGAEGGAGSERNGATDRTADGGSDRPMDRVSGRAIFTRSEYDFEGIYPFSSAVVSDVLVDGAYYSQRWRAACSLRYLDQDYGSSPDDFHFFTPQRNAWLDYRDGLTVARMVAFDLDRSTEIGAEFSWGRRSLSRVSASSTADRERRAGEGGGGVTAAIVSAGLVSRGFLDAIEHVYARLGIEHRFDSRFFVQGDGRLARYRKPSWGLEHTFVSGYLEGGYRNAWTEVSLGVGLDPVVLDPVVNRYADIGREEFLRRGIPAGLSRSRSADLGEGLRRQETSLRDYGAVKLEIILAF